MRLKIILTALAISITAYIATWKPASAAYMPITQEQGANWFTYFSSFTSVTAVNLDIAGLGGAGISKTPTANVNCYSYAIYPSSANATYQIASTTKTYSSNTNATATTGFNNAFPTNLYGLAPAISTSAPILALAGLATNGTMEAKTLNPVFIFTSLSAASTTYFWAECSTPATP